MQTIKINFVERNANRENNANYDNAAALERFFKAVIGLAQLSIRFKVDSEGQPIANIAAWYPNKKEEIKLILNQEILDYIFSVLYGKIVSPENIDAEDYADFKVEKGTDFAFEVFKNEIEFGKILTFKADFETTKTERYLCAESVFRNRNRVMYCIKRTEALEQYLTEKNLNN